MLLKARSRSAWPTTQSEFWVGTGSAIVEFSAYLRELEQRLAALEASRSAKP